MTHCPFRVLRRFQKDNLITFFSRGQEWPSEGEVV